MCFNKIKIKLIKTFNLLTLFKIKLLMIILKNNYFLKFYIIFYNKIKIR